MRQTEYTLIKSEILDIKEALKRLEKFIDHRIEKHRD